MPIRDLPEAASKAAVGILKDLRLKKGISMTLLAEKAGLSQSFISMLEGGTHNPSLVTIFRIAMALEVDLADIIRQAELKVQKARNG